MPVEATPVIDVPFEAPASAAEARALQQSLSTRIVLEDTFSPLLHIGGVDVGYDNARGLAHASVVVLDAETLALVEQKQAFVPVDFPYIPGLLSFREIPAILAAMAMLSLKPELWMVDGHGIAHPRRMGIATHLGVLLDEPTIGVGKSRLTGHFTMPGPFKGETSPLTSGHEHERIGTVLRSRNNVTPLFISPGHRVHMHTATELVLRCLTRYRLPEPTRLADKYSKCTPGARL